jgi:protein-disulfide isomerase
MKNAFRRRLRMIPVASVLTLTTLFAGLPESPVGDNPNGDVTVVEFFDHRCGVCKRIRPIIDTLQKSDGNIRRV